MAAKKKPATKKSGMIKGFFKKNMKYIILSVVMMIAGGSIERYKTQIYNFALSNFKGVLDVIHEATDTSELPEQKSTENAD